MTESKALYRTATEDTALYNEICALIAKSGIDAREIDAPGLPDRELRPAQKDFLLYWISQAIQPAKTKGKRTSYNLKHDLQAETRYYFRNSQFKAGMLLAGYRPIDPLALNWTFHIKRVVPRSRKEKEYVSDYRWRTVPYNETNKQLISLVHACDMEAEAAKNSSVK